MCSDLAPTTLVDVLHLDEECGVWSKTYTLGPIHCVIDKLSQCFKYGGEIVFNNAEMLYDPKTKRIKVIGYGHREFVSGCSFTPSLVFSMEWSRCIVCNSLMKIRIIMQL